MEFMKSRNEDANDRTCRFAATVQSVNLSETARFRAKTSELSQ